MQYYTMTTDAGDSAVAKAIQSGSMVTFTKMSVGDGNGTYYEPAKTQTALRNEVWSGTPAVQLDKNNSKRVTATIAIPASAGPFVVREAGLFDADGVLLVVAKVPLMEKVSPESGASDDLNMRVYVEVSDASVVTVVVDPSQINATKKDVDDAKAEVQAEVAAHTSNSDIHVTPLTCTTSGTVHALTGLSASSGLVSCVFKADADYAEGDTFTVDGTAVTAQLQNGESLPDEFFKAGATVPFIYDAENAKLNFKQSGGDMKLNVFAQPDMPTDKFDGILLQTSVKETIKKVIEDQAAYNADSWIKNFSVPTASQANSDVILYNNKLYHLSRSGSYVYDLATNSYRSLPNIPTTFSYDPWQLVLVGTKIYCMCSECYTFDFGTETYTNISINTNQIGPSVILVGSKIYNFGYYKTDVGNGTYLAIINTANSTYLMGAYIPTNESGMALYYQDGYIYMLGSSTGRNYKYSVANNTYTQLANTPVSTKYPGVIKSGDALHLFGGVSSNVHLTFSLTTETFSVLPVAPSTVSLRCVNAFKLSDQIVLLLSSSSSVSVKYVLYSSSYDSDPAVVLLKSNSISGYHTKLITGKKLEALNYYLNDAVLYKDGAITSPALYIGDGTQWNLARAAQQ